jgi:hypothetical protein
VIVRPALPAVAVAVAVLVLVLVLAGTGSAAGDSVRLTVTFARAPGGAGHVAHLRCSASAARADGFLRTVGARRACATARRLAAFLARRPRSGRVCSQIFGGTERGRIAGTIGTRRVNRAFARRDGCETADWRRAMPLLPRPR